MACNCACRLTGADGVTVTGSGSLVNPYVISSGGPGIDCPAALACVCSHLGAGLSCAGDTLGLVLSDDAGNALVNGSDGGLYGTAGDTCGDVGDCIAAAIDPPLEWDAINGELRIRRSADANNGISADLSNGLLMPEAADAAAWNTVASGFLNGATAGTPSPAWRKTRDGQVQWRGRINVTTNNTAMLTIPAGAVPAASPAGQAGTVMVMASTTANAIVQVTASATQLSWVRIRGTGTVVCLDGFTYF